MKRMLAALPPFNFDLSSRILANSDIQICNYENGKFWQIISVYDKLILATIKSVDSVDKPKVAAELKSKTKITEKDKRKAEEIITTPFSLNYDLKTFYEMVKGDEIITYLTRKL